MTHEFAANGDVWCNQYKLCFENVRDPRLKVDYLIIYIICDTDSVNKLTFQMYTLHKYK